MEYLLEYNKYSDLDKLNYLIKKYQSTRYFSSKMNRMLDEISDVKNFSDILFNKCIELNNFYEKCNSSVLSDILLEYFEDNYDFNIVYGIYTGGYSEKIKGTVTNIDSVDKNDRLFFLFTQILEILWSKTKISYDESELSRRDRHNKRPGIRHVYWKRSENYFKLVDKINPFASIFFEHKRIDDLNNYDNEYFDIQHIQGYGSKDLANYYSASDTISSKIVNRLNRFKLNFGATCVGTDLIWSHRPYNSYWDGETNVIINNPIISSGYLDIKFKL